ncbi:hypothetical protein PHYSODRAFT_303082 [Phytophthora sojae]|uniref:Uncharacterized protein n=1 Tax=Phytophthora sojae (strain P6497) TaxID=1094619 RepID=G4ZUW5_PHYSP|nr:hypothetical protein PHYSODRAFT_303082 [Phytophthora sojae]EGZ13589.1 hypothetical protein PHYSODRAFT_303082 [Phytophthora sojae]|eukprot:XP_009531018.1 hypothetical protein PHYSODRAFT_303082 [Phytophthora sojae]
MTSYCEHERLRRKSHGWRSLLHPSVLGAYLAVSRRIIVGPIVLLLLFAATNYLSPDATFLITSDNSIFAFTEKDLSMAGGGCTDCLGTCKIVLLTYAMYNRVALTSAPPFTAFTASAGHVTTLNLSIPQQTKRELELGIERAKDCVTTWSIIAISRLFLFPITSNSTEFGKIPAVAIIIAHDVTECRPDVPTDESLLGSKLALAMDGWDLLADVPEALTLFPYYDSDLACGQSRRGDEVQS